MTPTNFNNDLILWVELLETTFTHQQSKPATKIKLETLLSSLLYQKHLRSLVGRVLQLFGKEHIVW